MREGWRKGGREGEKSERREREREGQGETVTLPVPTNTGYCQGGGGWRQGREKGKGGIGTEVRERGKGGGGREKLSNHFYLQTRAIIKEGEGRRGILREGLVAGATVKNNSESELRCSNNLKI